MAATFGWLCVETILHRKQYKADLAATFGWLCVETRAEYYLLKTIYEQPPSGGCVLKLRLSARLLVLQVAATFGWLCVETSNWRLG